LNVKTLGSNPTGHLTPLSRSLIDLPSPQRKERGAKKPVKNHPTAAEPRFINVRGDINVAHLSN